MKERGSRSFSWLFYTFLLPIFFTAIIVFLIVQFILGINVAGAIGNYAVKFPVVRHTLGLAPVPVPIPEQVLALRGELNREVKKTTAFKLQVATLQNEVNHSKSVQISLKTSLHDVKHQLAALESAIHTAQNASTVYVDMSPTQAAQIISLLPFSQQVLTIRALDAATQASILGQLTSKQAAKLIQAGA